MQINRISEIGVEIFEKEAGVVANVENVNPYAWRMVVNATEKKDDQVLLAGPGSYEIAGVEAVGMKNDDGVACIYVFSVGGVNVCLLPELAEALSDKRIEKLEEIGVDVCLVNCNGAANKKNLLDAAKKIGSNVAIPLGSQKNIDEFLVACDLTGQASIANFKITADSLPEGFEVVIL